MKFRRFNRRGAQPEASTTGDEFCDATGPIGVILRCPQEDCELTSSASFSQVSSFLITDRAGLLSACVNRPPNCEQAECRNDVFEREIREPANINFLAKVLPTDVTVDLRN